MLIKIDDSVVQFLSERITDLTPESLEVKSLNNIATIQMEGFHKVIGSYQVLNFLRNLDLLELRSKSIYMNLFSKAAYFNSYEEFSTDFILLTAVEERLTRKIENQKSIFKVPINYFSELSKGFPTYLLSEDISDCYFYERIARKYLSENKKKINVKIKMEYGNGGGANSFKLLEHAVVNNKIVLSILDSDRVTPNGTEGETVTKLRGIYNKFESTAIIDLYCLGVREKENLVSPSMYCLTTNSSCRDILEILCQVESLEKHHDKLRFLDIKNGLKAKKLKNDPEYLEYLKELFLDVPELIACTYEEIIQQDDEFVLLNGIGGKLTEFEKDILEDGLEIKLKTKKELQGINGIETVIQKMEDNLKVKNNLFDSVPDYIKQDWEYLSKKIISWSFSDPLESGVS